MTLASKITVGRLFLVPVFVVFAVYYGLSVAAGEPEEVFRWWAVGIFILAAASDGLDGWIARRFNQRSSFGAKLDPVADKVLLLAGLVTLALVDWGEGNWRVPGWFLALAVARDVMILGGIAVLHFTKGFVPIRPHWSGKVCTFTQMVLLGWVMLKWIDFSPLWPTIFATVFTIWSGVAYFLEGLSQLKAENHEK